MSLVASGKRSTPVRPRLKIVTSWPPRSASSTIARPTKSVPPRTRMRMSAETTPRSAELLPGLERADQVVPFAGDHGDDALGGVEHEEDAAARVRPDHEPAVAAVLDLHGEQALVDLLEVVQ